MSNATDTRVTTGRVRFSYANLFHPRSVNGGPEKYSVTLLIPKADKKTMDKILANFQNEFGAILR